MYFAHRVFTLAKDPERPGEYQDAWRVSLAHGIAAVADGVASAIFSAQWADLLVAGVAEESPDPRDAESFGQWLRGRRQAWAGGIDTRGLAWFQKAKLPLGAFSTLLWVAVRGDEHGEPDKFAYRAWAIGDSCLFHLRGAELLRVFPIQRVEQFDEDPVVLGSTDLNRDHNLTFALDEGECLAGDLIVLASDAVAQWALRSAMAGQPPNWKQFWRMDEATWRVAIDGLRQAGAMRYDDATLVLLSIGGEPAEEPEDVMPAPVEAAATGVVAGLPTGVAAGLPTVPPHSTAGLPSETPLADDGEREYRLAPLPEPEQPVDVAPIGGAADSEEVYAAEVIDDKPEAPKRDAGAQLVDKIDTVSDRLLRGMRSVFDKAAAQLKKAFGPKGRDDKTED